MRDLEGLIVELDSSHSSDPTSQTPGAGNRSSTPASPQPAPARAVSGGKAGPRSLCMCAITSLLALYLKVRGIAQAVPWLLVLAPLWLSGVLFLFRVSIPRMLSAVEAALGLQLSSDRERVLEGGGGMRQHWSTPLRGREWDEVERGCCMAGLWSGSVAHVLSCLGLALVLGFVMIAALQLEIVFISPQEEWQVLAPLAAGHCFTAAVLLLYYCFYHCFHSSMSRTRARRATVVTVLQLLCC